MTTGFDREAEQEVDFARYGRMLASRWWLVAVGVVAGAVIGFLLSLGGTKVYSATATIYLGQPYNAAGTAPVVNLATNPSAVGQIAKSESMDHIVAKQCGTTTQTFHNGISTMAVATNASTKGLGAQVNPLVSLTVQAPKGTVAACVANGLARAAVAKLGAYPRQKVQLFENRIAIDNAAIRSITAALANPNLALADKYFQSQRLTGVQQDLFTWSGLLAQAQQVELPKVSATAAARQVTAASPRNTVLIAALIGLILGAIAALLWDRLLPRSAS